MADSSIRENSRLLTVPKATHDGASVRARSSGLRSRSPSPASSSRSQSPTRTLGRTPSPVISGSPYLRNRCPSAVSLCPLSNAVSLRPYHSAVDLVHLRQRSTSSVAVHVVGSSEETIELPELTTAAPSHATAPPEENPQDKSLQALSPKDVENTKYTPRRLSCVKKAQIELLEPFTFDITARYAAPEGWDRCVAPEGNVYFHHKKLRTFTHANMEDEVQVQWIEDTAKEMQRRLAPMPHVDDIDIVLDYRQKGYYLTSWPSKYIFWADPVKPQVVTEGVREAHFNTHYLMHSLFWCGHWRHVQMFPNQYTLSEEYVEELRDLVTYGYGDITSSETSTFPYDSEKLLHIARVIDRVRGGLLNPYHISTVARYLDNLNYERFLHYHGEVCARLDRLESVHHDTEPSRTLLFKVLSVLLFYLPDLYFQELRKVYVDQTVHYYAWRRFISELKTDWENSITPATVLLSANVGFLAIQSLDNITSYSRSIAQIASYASALLSLIDYVVVQILMRQHRHHLFDTAERGMQFITRREDRVGLEMVALSVSLPGGLFIWSMLTFLFALEFIFYHHSNVATIATLSAVGVVLVVMVAVLFAMNLLGDAVDATPLRCRLSTFLWGKVCFMLKYCRTRFKTQSDPKDGGSQRSSWLTRVFRRNPSSDSPSAV